MDPLPPGPASLRLRVVVAAWSLVLAGAMTALAAYGAAPGEQRPAPRRWPAALDAALAPPPGRLRLVLAAHPRCPCTRASLRELERLVSHRPGALEATVLFFQPEGAGSAWRETALWRLAEELHHVTPVADLEGGLAATVGALTSGHAVVYDARGTLRFQGGLTGARGHEGDNAGTAAVRALIGEAATAAASAEALHGNPVFGCDLSDPERDTTRPAPRTP